MTTSRRGTQPPKSAAKRPPGPAARSTSSVSRPASTGTDAKRHGIARVLSKRGVCSRTQAAEWVRAGRVRVGGRVVRDPEYPVALDRDDITVDDAQAAAVAPLYLMLNKPRGLVTTVRDERGRDTVYRCFDRPPQSPGPVAGAMPDTLPADAPVVPPAFGTPGDRAATWIAPVGRLDKASEGLLLFTNDPAWAARITDPATGPDKTYHVQIDRIPDDALLAALCVGCEVEGERLRARAATLLRAGERNAWLEIVLDEGRNRQIRRLLDAFGIAVLRLVRVAIGGLQLGTLPKGAWRALQPDELRAILDPTAFD